uniref:Uncharacterized protein n=1 Tax=Anguilla anguilla TaxID=7936 RepID=A0A0E9X6M4_ANGAN
MCCTPSAYTVRLNISHKNIFISIKFHRAKKKKCKCRRLERARANNSAYILSPVLFSHHWYLVICTCCISSINLTCLIVTTNGSRDT